MSEINIPSYVKAYTLEAKIVRADGTVENLGKIASWSRDESFLRKLINTFKK